MKNLNILGQPSPRMCSFSPRVWDENPAENLKFVCIISSSASANIVVAVAAVVAAATLLDCGCGMYVI